MAEAAIIGLDFGKNVFQVRGAALDGFVLFCKKLSMVQFALFMAEQQTCLVATTACGSGQMPWIPVAKASDASLNRTAQK
jgi:hypothetical protein